MALGKTVRARYKKGVFELLRLFLRRVSVLPFTDEVAWRFGEENARLQATGQPLSQFDVAITATALRHGLTLLTEKRRHYERIPGLAIQSLAQSP